MLFRSPPDACRGRKSHQRQVCKYVLQATCRPVIALRQDKQEILGQHVMPLQPVHVIERVRGNHQVGPLRAQKGFMVTALSCMQRQVFDRDFRLQQPDQRRRQRRGDRRQHPDAQHADRLRTLVTHGGGEVFDRVEDALRMTQAKFARLCQPHRPHRTVDEPCVTGILERGKLLRGGRLRHSHQPRCLGELTGFRNCDKDFQRRQKVLVRRKPGGEFRRLH